MTMFMILALPLMIVYSIMAKDFFIEAKQRVFSIVIGITMSIIYTFIDLFFTSPYYTNQFAFFPNFLHSFFFEIAIPIAFCSFFILLFIKNKQNKWYQLYFMLLGFLVVYFPARIFNENALYNWYLLFSKPIIILSMLYSLKNCIIFSYSYRDTLHKELKTHFKVFSIIGIVFSYILCLTIPSVIDSLYILDIPNWVLAIVSVLYCGGTIVGTLFANLRLIQKSD